MTYRTVIRLAQRRQVAPNLRDIIPVRKLDLPVLDHGIRSEIVSSHVTVRYEGYNELVRSKLYGFPWDVLVYLQLGRRSVLCGVKAERGPCDYERPSH